MHLDTYQGLSGRTANQELGYERRIVTAYYRARVRRQEITQEQSPCP